MAHIFNIGDVRTCKAGHTYTVTERMWLKCSYPCPACAREKSKLYNAKYREQGVFKSARHLAKSQRWRDANREQVREESRRRRLTTRRPTKSPKYNPLKSPARWQVWKAVRDGRLTRQPCQCGTMNTEAHHTDYTKPLEVMWLCKRCHHDEHNRLREIARSEKAGRALT